MKHSSELFVNAPAGTLVEVLSDLATYPSWNGLVGEARSVKRTPEDAGPVWMTTLTAKVGPFARSKQLRFVRDKLETPLDGIGATEIRFSRRELDDRTHADWTMLCTVEENAKDNLQSIVSLTLSYDGDLWVPALGTVLDRAMSHSIGNLGEYARQL